MTRMTTRFALIVTTALAISAISASAQTSDSAEDIAEKFNQQKTRGLVIVPSTASTTAATDDNEVAVAPADVNYNQVDRDQQVNIQISFDFDSAALREDQKPKLSSLCEAMKSVDVAVFQIIGHTDSSGGVAYNERLSLLRAEEVKRHLVSDCGIDDARLQAIGLGETAPFDPNDPRGDVNRRVEFQALG